MTVALNRALSKNEIFVMSDFNNNIESSNRDKDKLETFCDISILSITGHSETCFKD